MIVKALRTKVKDSTAFKAYVRLAKDWRLTNQESCDLLGVQEDAYGAWKTDLTKARLSDDQIMKLSYPFNIYDGLHRIFGDPQFANEWVRLKNTEFNEKAPLSLLFTGDLAGFQTVHKLIQRILNL